MGRTPKPWLDAERGLWRVTIDGKRVTLAEGKANKRAAIEAFHVLMAERKDRPKLAPAPAGISVETLVESFLDHAEKNLRPLSVTFYGRHLRDFWRHVGTIAAVDVRPYHLTSWLDTKTVDPATQEGKQRKRKTWGPTSRHCGITAVKRLFSWARKEGYLEIDRLKDYSKPRANRREVVMTVEQFERLLVAVKDQEFRDLLTFARLTGARPSESMAVEARHVDFERSRVVMASKTTHATGRDRVIRLNREALALCRKLAGLWPDGPIFRNVFGRPWTRHATSGRFTKLRKKLGFGDEATMESLRHEWITDGLVRGVPMKTVAELAGHTSTAMVDKHYSKIHQRDDHLTEALDKIRPDNKKVS